MIIFDDVSKKYIKEHNLNRTQIPDHPYRIVIIWGAGSGINKSLFSLISKQPDLDQIYLYAKAPYDTKYRFLINKRKSTCLKHSNDSKAFI